MFASCLFIYGWSTKLYIDCTLVCNSYLEEFMHHILEVMILMLYYLQTSQAPDVS